MGSMYDNGDTIEFIGDDDTVYRVSLKELVMPLLNDMEFEVTMERKYKHLKLITSGKRPCSLCGSVMEH
jgi:hypothetical protein